RIAIYLYYYEGYNTREIAALLRRPASTIRNYLHEARRLLRGQIEDLDI
ncbi:MAG: helix-turn-helix domain-containing protein, partial [Clostridiaceae bacterium]|nr:helix-turn-helix domain-containing protein [Clostridiaceae bacterium]